MGAPFCSVLPAAHGPPSCRQVLLAACACADMHLSPCLVDAFITHRLSGRGDAHGRAQFKARVVIVVLLGWRPRGRCGGHFMEVEILRTCSRQVAFLLARLVFQSLPAAHSKGGATAAAASCRSSANHARVGSVCGHAVSSLTRCVAIGRELLKLCTWKMQSEYVSNSAHELFVWCGEDHCAAGCTRTQILHCVQHTGGM